MWHSEEHLLCFRSRNEKKKTPSSLVIFCQIKTQCVGKESIKSLEDRDRHFAVKQGMVYRSKIAIVWYPRKTGSTFTNF